MFTIGLRWVGNFDMQLTASAHENLLSSSSSIYFICISFVFHRLIYFFQEATGRLDLRCGHLKLRFSSTTSQVQVQVQVFRTKTAWRNSYNKIIFEQCALKAKSLMHRSQRQWEGSKEEHSPPMACCRGRHLRLKTKKQEILAQWYVTIEILSMVLINY